MLSLQPSGEQNQQHHQSLLTSTTSCWHCRNNKCAMLPVNVPKCSSGWSNRSSLFSTRAQWPHSNQCVTLGGFHQLLDVKHPLWHIGHNQQPICAWSCSAIVQQLILELRTEAEEWLIQQHLSVIPGICYFLSFVFVQNQMTEPSQRMPSTQCVSSKQPAGCVTAWVSVTVQQSQSGWWTGNMRQFDGENRRKSTEE